MDAFQLIQNFFTRMRCNFCSHPFIPDDIQLLRKDDGVFVVNVYCNHCRTQNGVAIVGVEVGAMESSQVTDMSERHPELTDDEVKRLSEFKAVSANDVIDAHYFFNKLDADWMKFIPSEMLERCIKIQTESHDE